MQEFLEDQLCSFLCNMRSIGLPAPQFPARWGLLEPNPGSYYWCLTPPARFNMIINQHSVEVTTRDNIASLNQQLANSTASNLHPLALFLTMRTTSPFASQIPLLIGVEILTIIAFILSLLTLLAGTSANSPRQICHR